MNENEIEALAIALVNAKDAENQAKAARIEAEKALSDAIGGSESGRTTRHIGRFGVTVTRGFNYKIDTPKLFATEYPDFVRVREEIKIDERAYEAQRSVDSELYREMAEHVTVTPKKPSVEIRL